MKRCQMMVVVVMVVGESGDEVKRLVMVISG